MSDVDVDELVAALAARAVPGGPTAVIEVRVDAKAKAARRAVVVSLADGGVESVAAVDPASDDAGEVVPEVVVLLPPALAAELAAGALDLPVAYMRGDAKLEGDPGAVLDVLRWFEGLARSS